MGRPPKALAVTAAAAMRAFAASSLVFWVWLRSVGGSEDFWEQLVSPHQVRGGTGREKGRQQSEWLMLLSRKLQGVLASACGVCKRGRLRPVGRRSAEEWAHRFQNFPFPPAFRTGPHRLSPKKLPRESTWELSSEPEVSFLGKPFLQTRQWPSGGPLLVGCRKDLLPELVAVLAPGGTGPVVPRVGFAALLCSSLMPVTCSLLSSALRLEGARARAPAGKSELPLWGNAT